jgi:SanA protein
MRQRIFLAVGALFVVCVVSLFGARVIIARASKNKTYWDISAIPNRHVGLVFGCPKKTYGGYANPFFNYRMNAAAALFFNGKVDYIVVSGDNHTQSYDEPVDMKNALIERGVPASHIYLDYAGFRTLDSVVRVKEIFGQDVVTVISQNFQNQRAIFLAQHHGIDAIGFNAEDVPPQFGLKTLVREQFAKVKAILDVYILHTQPHFLGLKINIGDT